eukprot:GILJ01002633.1.p1 GENE.GILJ01002633.1~~GILJ01002633.1.p1  ORF type:complete len:566 (+),score=80.46 GILJ01002633.1:73-1698(+)
MAAKRPMRVAVGAGNTPMRVAVGAGNSKPKPAVDAPEKQPRVPSVTSLGTTPVPASEFAMGLPNSSPANSSRRESPLPPPSSLLPSPSPSPSPSPPSMASAPPSVPVSRASSPLLASNLPDSVFLSSSPSFGNGSAVFVAVRVRPLNDRERKMESSACVTVESEAQLRVADPSSSQHRAFTFDAVFHEGASQEMVFERTAATLIDKILYGYNSCVFAYGQTGSGKTHTMQGSTDQPGLIPRLCELLFAAINDPRCKYDYNIRASYVEIYNENLRDLIRLTPEQPDVLKINEDKLKGIVVQNLTQVPVQTNEDIVKLIERGTAKRTVGETAMNAVSSRSHAVLTLYLECQDREDKDGFTMKFVKLNLVDLAGSERAGDTQASGERLREGANINKSLSTLQAVIKALTEKSTKSRAHVPFRDSKLTRLLQDSLGANSLVMMFCNVSPATVNAADSISSLRFADNAKRLQNTVTVNRDPRFARIAELLEENANLKKRILELESRFEPLDGTMEAVGGIDNRYRTNVRMSRGAKSVTPSKCCILM